VDGSTLESITPGVSQPFDVLAAAEAVGTGRHLGQGVADLCGPAGRTKPAAVVGILYRRDLCPGKKRGAAVGKTKRGKGTKLMVVADSTGLPVGEHVHSASPNEGSDSGGGCAEPGEGALAGGRQARAVDCGSGLRQ